MYTYYIYKSKRLLSYALACYPSTTLAHKQRRREKKREREGEGERDTDRHVGVVICIQIALRASKVKHC